MTMMPEVHHARLPHVARGGLQGEGFGQHPAHLARGCGRSPTAGCCWWRGSGIRSTSSSKSRRPRRECHPGRKAENLSRLRMKGFGLSIDDF